LETNSEANKQAECKETIEELKEIINSEDESTKDALKFVGTDGKNYGEIVTTDIKNLEEKLNSLEERERERERESKNSDSAPISIVKNYYQILEVNEKATQEEIKKAYRKLATQ
jgi:hypothetical protein